MEISNSRNFAHELGLMDDPSCFHQWPLEDPGPVSFGSPFEDPGPGLERAPESTQYQPNKPLKQLIRSSTSSTGTFRFIDDVNRGGLSWPKMETWTLDFPSESSFGISKNPELKPKRAVDVGANTRPKDNVLAERRRREKLSQRFVDLSALVPGLKKMDKASILGDAIKYTKQLQERVKTLEHQNKKKSVESVVFVKKHLHCPDNSNSSDQKISVAIMAEPLPEIEARLSDDHVQINIHCKKRNGLLEKTVAEVEKLHLSVVSSSAITFGDSALYIVVTAKKEEENSTTNTKELVQNLCTALQTHLK